ncbi:hypothetical protein PHMEG_00026366 [Phytophthora megakarya]|uniref:Ubiquitin-like protease family profile domain-containing protein n=1 Tax=Phytophthora megakarya TaxID=4795 RepID=A0A225VAJ8_9STRA|nr:hypothetical protein PHMEG_00026366 [Phytophthora megakarya]
MQKERGNSDTRELQVGISCLPVYPWMLCQITINGAARTCHPFCWVPGEVYRKSGAASADSKPEVLATLASLVDAKAEPKGITSLLAENLKRDVTPQQARNIVHRMQCKTSAEESLQAMLNDVVRDNGDVLLLQDQLQITVGIAIQTEQQKLCFQNWGDCLVLDWTHGTKNKVFLYDPMNGPKDFLDNEWEHGMLPFLVQWHDQFNLQLADWNTRIRKPHENIRCQASFTPVRKVWLRKSKQTDGSSCGVLIIAQANAILNHDTQFGKLIKPIPEFCVCACSGTSCAIAALCDHHQNDCEDAKILTI